MQITEGKWRGLEAVADQTGVIRALAMDQRGSLRKAIAKEKGIEVSQVTDAMMSEFKVAVSRILTPYASAILLDPEWGLEAIRARHPGTGLLLAYEASGYDNTRPGRIPDLVEHWTVKKSLEHGADCIKLLLYYNPFEEARINEIKHAFVARIGAECAYHDVAFFLEFVGYDPAGGDEKGIEYARKKPEIVAGSMREFSKPDYHVDVLKVEIPVSLQYVKGSRSSRGDEHAYSREEALDHYRQAAEAAGKPFIYLSAGVSDQQFLESLQLALEAQVNFAGVLCGRATWKEGIPEYARGGLGALEDWLENRGVRNIQALNAVLSGARPWYAKYGGKDKIQKVSGR
ncbi:MAG: tagatose 1,6-diphosphate aldolase [Acidobacteria bacterium]|nr:tagatose 1,6-diphosphate aldolase [Acidobacteriota bacterium]